MMNFQKTWSFTVAVLAPVLLADIASSHERVTPFEWREKLVDANRDLNGNFIEDSLEDIADKTTLGVSAIVALNKCLNFNEMQKFEDYGDIDFISKSISAITLKNLDTARLVELANETEVAFVFEDKTVSSNIDISVPSAQITRSNTYSPETVHQAFPDVLQAAEQVSIAIIDSGVDDNHRSLPAPVGFYDAVTRNQVNPPDSTGHGTHVAGIALSRDDTRPGACITCQLVDVRVLNDEGAGTSTDLMRGLEFVLTNRFDMNIRVANLSLGESASSDGQDPVSQVVNRLSRAGVIVVAAAGNDGENIIPAPAAADEAFAVSAMNDGDEVDRSTHRFADFSNFGPRLDDNDTISSDEEKPDISAPGDRITSAQSGTATGFRTMSGTSQATPLVSGFMGLVAAMRPGITPRSVREILRAQGTAWDEEVGFGQLNAFRLLELADQQAATNLGFDQHCGTSYRPDSLIPLSEPIYFNQANRVTATITNFGTRRSGRSRAKIGLYKFGNSPQSWDICERVVPSLAPGETVDLECDWRPRYQGHACLKADLAYQNDTDYSNNCAQRNVDILSVPQGQSEIFTAEVSHDNPKTTLIRTTVSTSNNDWDVEIPAEFQEFYMYPSECPRTVEIKVTPKDATAAPVTIDVSFEFDQQNWTYEGAFERPLHGVSAFASVQ